MGKWSNPYPVGILSIMVFGLMQASILMLSSFHPLVLTIVIILISGFTAMVLSTLVSTWLLLAMMLIFLGGMMVIFSYITSLANSDKLSLSWPSYPLLFLSGVTAWAAPALPSVFHFPSTIYALGSGGILLYLTAYLLLTLMAIVKLVQHHKGALTTYMC